MMMMKRLLLVLALAALFAIPAVGSTAATRAHTAGAKHCGSFKLGLDGFPPGPSGIRGSGVSCWFARATALIGAPPGWRCRDTEGLLFVCKSRGMAVRGLTSTENERSARGRL